MKPSDWIGAAFMAVVLMFLVYVVFFLPSKKPETAPQVGALEEMQQEVDSLDTLLKARPKSGTVFITQYIKIEQRLQQKKDSVVALAPDDMVQYFALRTASDSIPMLSDSSAAVKTEALETACILFIEGDAAKEKVVEMTGHLAAKDTTINLQKQRIVSGDSISATEKQIYTAEIKSVKKDRNKYRLSTYIAAALLAASLFF